MASPTSNPGNADSASGNTEPRGAAGPRRASGAGSASGSAGPMGGPDDVIGATLRQAYDATVAEAVPESLLDLLSKLR